jgi:hypothetical protein
LNNIIPENQLLLHSVLSKNPLGTQVLFQGDGAHGLIGTEKFLYLQ